MKKVYVIVLALILVFALAACGGSGGGDDNGGVASGGGSTAAPASSPDDEHNCPCEPECNNKECKGGDKCQCSAGEMAMTYIVEIKTVWEDIDPTCPYPAECGGVSIASATVSVNSGAASGSGEYVSYNSHYWDSEGRTLIGKVAPGTDFGFKATLAIPEPNNANIIKVGFDFSGESDVTMNWSNGEVLQFPGMMDRISGMFKGVMRFAGEEFDIGEVFDPGTYEFDHDTGFAILELPLTGGVMEKTFDWDSVAGITMTITLTPA